MVKKSDSSTGEQVVFTTCQAHKYELYSTQVKPFVSKCAACHNGNPGVGTSQAAFASLNPLTGFNWFVMVGPTKLSAYGTNAEHGAGTAGIQNQASLDGITEAWRSIEDKEVCKNTGGAGLAPHKTAAKTIQATTVFRVITWNLGSDLEEGSSDFGGATFEIQIKKGEANGTAAASYFISSPIIKTAGSPIEVKELYVYINGVRLDASTTFTEIDKFIPAGNTTTLLSTGTTVVDMAQAGRDGIKETDTIAVSFSHLVKSSGSGPPNPTPTPAPLNGAQLYTTNCASCHGQLAVSTKKNRTAIQFRAAIVNVNTMKTLVLTDAELQAMATALAQ